jgi:opacity protein-like surface antigen
LVELFGGFAFARMVSGGSSTNFNGAVGAFGYNLKPWLQIVGDSSYSFVTVSGTKNVLYGNHYGGRYYYHPRNRWSITPFAEALVGGSRADATISGAGGYTISQNSISFKVGGGVDFRPSRRWEIRLFDVDYYRTSFGTNAHQNNYWASTGIVLRLFGGRSE